MKTTIHRRLQFGMRENPACDGRHGSRLPVSTPPNSNYIGKVNARCLATTNQTETELADAHASASAATPQAATGQERENNNQLLTVHEVAELLRVPVSWVYGRTRKRSLERLPGYRIGKYWRFREDEIHAWVERQR